MRPQTPRNPLDAAHRASPDRLVAAGAARDYASRHGAEALAEAQEPQFDELRAIHLAYRDGEATLDEAVALLNAAFRRFTVWLNSH